MKNNKPVSLGKTGELVVSGSQLSPGYWDDKIQTKKSFKKNSINKDIPNIFYHSGDLLRLEANGLYYFVGRKDSQVKVQGKRIELGEIENLICSFLEVIEASVIILKREDSKDTKIIAYVNLPKSNLKQNFENYLKENLPKYMLPSKIIYLKKELPRLTNGKVDKKELNNLALSSYK